MSKHKNFHGVHNRRQYAKAYEAMQRRSPYAVVRKTQLKKTAPSAANAESGDKVEIEPVSTLDDTRGIEKMQHES